MTDEVPRDTVADGLTAQRILDDPVFRDAVATTDAQIVREWRQADTPEVRERAHIRQEVLDDLVRALRRIAARGETETTLAERNEGV